MTTSMMIDGAEGPSPFGRWENESANDALPYADVLPEGWRAGVDQLVQEEMRRMKKRPKDYLDEMVPAREIDWRGCPLLQKEFDRVAAGSGGMPPPDATRYELAPPPKSKRSDEDAWEAALRNARAQLEHQALRIQNLELAAKFAPNAWRAQNASLEAAITTYVTLFARQTGTANDLSEPRARLTHATSRLPG
jgi:pre-mRNA-splicing factor SPF27